MGDVRPGRQRGLERTELSQLYSSEEGGRGQASVMTRPQRWAARGTWCFEDQVILEHSGRRGLTLRAPPPSQGGDSKGLEGTALTCT